MAFRSIIALTLGLWACALAAEPPPKPEPLLQGRITNSRGQPLVGAVVRLRLESPNFSAPDPNEASYTATTAGDGSYTFPTAAPGPYRLYADHDGYVRGFYGPPDVPAPGAVVEIARDHPLRGYDIQLRRPGTLSGRVVNREGQPVLCTVSALSIVINEFGREFLPVKYTETDDQGRFQLTGLFPGSYLLQADQYQQRQAFSRLGSERHLAVVKSLSAAVFYPNLHRAEDGVAIAVVPESDLRGFEVTIDVPRKVSVRGTVKFPQPPSQPLHVSLYPESASDARGAILPLEAVVASSGAFQFPYVDPGSYVLQPSRFYPGESANRTLGIWQPITVGSDDLDNVEVAVVPVHDLRGRVVVEPDVDQPLPAAQTDTRYAVPHDDQSKEGAKTPVPALATGLSDLAIRLFDSRGVTINGPKAVTSEDGRFSFDAPRLGVYRFQVQNLPSHTYLKAIQWQGRDINGRALELTTDAPGEVTILLGSPAAHVSGRVTTADGKPVSGSVVSLWPATPKADRPFETARTAMTNAQGEFAIEQLAPGRYLAVAWNRIEAAQAAYLVLCRQFSGVATEIEVKTSASISLTPISQRDLDDAIARIR